MIILVKCTQTITTADVSSRTDAVRTAVGLCASIALEYLEPMSPLASLKQGNRIMHVVADRTELVGNGRGRSGRESGKTYGVDLWKLTAKTRSFAAWFEQKKRCFTGS